MELVALYWMHVVGARGPHMIYAGEVYEMIISLPDEIVWKNSENEPSVRLA